MSILVFPTILPNQAPVRAISPTAVTYDEINASISSGAFRLKVNAIYFQCENNQQLSATYAFNNITQSGGQKINPDIYNINPNQFQSAALIDLKDKNVIFDNLNYFTYNIQPFQKVSLVFFADYITNMDAFHDNEIINSPNNEQQPLNLPTKNDNNTIQLKAANIAPIALTAAILGGLFIILKKA